MEKWKGELKESKKKKKKKTTDTFLECRSSYHINDKGLLKKGGNGFDGLRSFSWERT